MRKKMLILCVAIFITGCGHAPMVKTNNADYVRIGIDDFNNNYINMNDVIDFKATETDLTLYTKSGDSYYWEKVKWK